MTSRRPAALLLGALLLTTACTSASGPGSAASAPAVPTTAADEPAESPRPPLAVRALTSAEVQYGWWNWAAGSRAGRSPVADPDGRWCAERQHEDIWYLAGTTGGDTVERTCAVPLGLPVLFPLVTIVGEAADCEAFMDRAGGSATLDGAPLPVEPLGATRIKLVSVAGNAFGATVTDSDNTWSCGLWVRLEPLTPGNHELTLRGESGRPGFSVGVDYHLRAAVPTPTGAV
ncbi:signal protein [Kitasatospora sp. NPDC056327]|uniref:signal protein n=1 Tax=Kitasatospora sp. NPDC056327 TaxID=3345785 RepID=UPI0035DF129F